MTHCPNFSPGDPGEIRAFSENCTTASNIKVNNLKTQKQFFPFFRKTGSVPGGGPREHTINFQSFDLYLVLFVHFYRLSPGDILTNFGQNEFSKISKKWKMLIITTFKQNSQKTIFHIFPKNGSETCWGSSRTHHQFWFNCPVFTTFRPFLPIVPRGHFGQFWTKWIFENFEKNAKC